ncbi:hypothetical protein RBH29_04520 [Herbivorax sp. ANBcel31]|uniref:hypothetical protein n=1 Tax=Herbivorax sp. ANBcel31 TaxID=3069754 RepID=UPI0027AF12FC|nr:hypothetical protein [Herbivorax sp. ANBcel31]MDQ2085698.1 hypothetical protein [Herbivorax sp. ANBcel31]
MKNIAIGILIIILTSIIIEPMVETVNILRERVILTSALTNSFRAAKDRSIEEDSRRDLHASVDEELFIEYFCEAFEDAMNLSLSSIHGNEIIFVCENENYNDFNITVKIDEYEDDITGQIVSEVNLKAASIYNFKTKYLNLAENSLSSDYMLTGERTFLLFVRN